MRGEGGGDYGGDVTVLVDVGGLGFDTGLFALDAVFDIILFPPYSPNQVLNHPHAIGPKWQASPSTPPPSPSSPSTTMSSSHINISTQALLSLRQLTTNPFFSTAALPLQTPSPPFDSNNSLIYTPPPLPFPSLQHTPSKPIHFLLNPVPHKFLTQIASTSKPSIQPSGRNLL